MPFTAILLLLLFLNGIECRRELKFVQAMHRHGDRAPIDLPYVTDPYNESYWRRGWSQLTNLGMKQLKELGTFLKDRYTGPAFIDKHFNHNQVVMVSSDSDRALVSAQCVLNGFFPTIEHDDKFEADLLWQPIAVHSAAGQNQPDPLLRPTAYNCPFYNEKLQIVNAPLYQSLKTKYQNLFDFLTTNTGYKSPITIEQAARLNDLNREIAHGLKQPEWVKKSWPEYDGNTTLKIVTDLERILRNAEFEDISLAYLRGGFILNDLIQRAKKVVNGTQTHPTKMLLYSTHDGTLLALMNLLDIADGRPIAYGGCFIMEIYEEDGDYFVEFYYRHDQTLTRICVGGCCNSQCSLESFISNFDSRTIKSREELDDICTLPWSKVNHSLHKLKHKLAHN